VPIDGELPTRELSVVRGLFRRKQPTAELLSKPVSQIGGPTTRPIPRSISGVSNSGPHPSVPVSSPKRRRKRVQVEGLFLEAEPEPLMHARALLQLVQTECPEKMGKYVPQSNLERTYRQMCTQNEWSPKHWTAIGRRLGRLTDRRTVKRDGKRFRAYRIPSPKDRSHRKQRTRIHARDCPGIAPGANLAEQKIFENIEINGAQGRGARIHTNQTHKVRWETPNVPCVPRSFGRHVSHHDVPLGEARLATGSDALCVACGQRPRAVAGRLSRCLPCIKAEAARARDASQKAHARVAALANQKVEVI
jgi:hypothetical protein